MKDSSHACAMVLLQTSQTRNSTKTTKLHVNHKKTQCYSISIKANTADSELTGTRGASWMLDNRK